MQETSHLPQLGTVLAVHVTDIGEVLTRTHKVTQLCTPP